MGDGAASTTSTIAQLSDVITSEALDVAVVEDGAGVEATTGDRNSRSARAEINRCG